MSFGTIGIIIEIGIETINEFEVTKSIYKDLYWDSMDYKQLIEQFDYLSLFCNWQDRKMNSVWCTNIGRQRV